jgi:hypothetical protein
VVNNYDKGAAGVFNGTVGTTSALSVTERQPTVRTAEDEDIHQMPGEGERAELAADHVGRVREISSSERAAGLFGSLAVAARGRIRMGLGPAGTPRRGTRSSLATSTPGSSDPRSRVTPSG